MVDEMPEFDDLIDEGQGSAKTQVMPAYEYVKRNILYCWLNIESQYEKYIYLTSIGKSYRIEIIVSKVLSLYKTLLRPMMAKMKVQGVPEFVVEMDGYISEDFKIPEAQLDHVINEFATFMNAIKLTDITHEVKPWQESFRDSYPS